MANEPRFADMPPARIGPVLADEGVYIASESTFCQWAWQFVHWYNHEHRHSGIRFVSPSAMPAKTRGYF